MRHRVCRMAREAILGVAVPEFPPGRLFETVRSQALIADRRAQPMDRRIVTHEAFVETPIALEHPGLHALAEGPAYGNGSRATAVGDAVRAFAAGGFDRVGVLAFFYRELGVRLQRRIVASHQQRLPHWGLPLVGAFGGVTSGARGGGQILPQAWPSQAQQ